MFAKSIFVVFTRELQSFHNVFSSVVSIGIEQPAKYIAHTEFTTKEIFKAMKCFYSFQTTKMRLDFQYNVHDDTYEIRFVESMSFVRYNNSANYR